MAEADKTVKIKDKKFFSMLSLIEEFLEALFQGDSLLIQKCMKKSFFSLFAVIATVVLFFLFCYSAKAEGTTEAKIYNNATSGLHKSFKPYGEGFSKGASLAVGDVTGDGQDDIVAASGQGTRTFVRVFSISGSPLAWSVRPFHPGYTGGASVAIGDVDGDGKNEIVLAPSGAGGPIVMIYKYGASKAQIHFLAFAEGFRGGVNVACGDINKDGKDEIIVGTASQRGNIAVYRGNGDFTGLSYFPFGTEFRDGLSVSAGDVNGNGKADIIAGSQGLTTSRVKIYKADASKKILGEFLAYGEGFLGGVNTAVADLSQDGISEIITSVASNGAPHIRSFDASGNLKSPYNFFAFDKDEKGGVNISASSDWLVALPAKKTVETNICKSKRCVALTFDDGGSRGGSLEGILATLGRHNVKATFFLVGKWMNVNRDWVKQISNAGHRLGNHTWNHSICTRIPDQQIKDELTQADQLVQLIVGKTLKPHFRYPGGGHDSRTDAVVRGKGYYYWQWTSDPRDAMGNHSPESIKQIALSGLHPGSVILFHTGNSATAQALDGIIKGIKAQGYELVTLDQMEWKAENQW